MRYFNIIFKVIGYWETHGKTEFLPGEQYNLTDDEKKAVLWRYRVKEILKREFMRREFDPHNYKYKVCFYLWIVTNFY